MPSGLGSIERDLPPFGRQVPTGSIALIGYTVGSYSSKANPTDVSLSMNVLWVAVLAASEDTWQVNHSLCFTSLLIIAFQVVPLFSVSFMMTQCSEWWRLWSRFWCSLSFTLLCIQPPYGIYIVFNYLTAQIYPYIVCFGTQLPLPFTYLYRLSCVLLMID